MSKRNIVKNRDKTRTDGRPITFYLTDDEYFDISQRFVPEMKRKLNDGSVGVGTVVRHWVREKLSKKVA